MLGTRLLGKLMPLNAVVEVSPDAEDPTSSIAYRKALDSAANGLHGKAVEELKDALRENGDFADAYHELGKAYENLGKSNLAIKAFQSAIKIRPDQFETYAELGRVYDSSGNFLEAIKSYMKVLRLKPNSSEARIDIGRAYFNIGSYAEAQKALTQALQLDENSSRAHFSLGLVYVDLGHRDLALDKYEWLQDRGETKMASLLMEQINREFGE